MTRRTLGLVGAGVTAVLLLAGACGNTVTPRASALPKLPFAAGASATASAKGEAATTMAADAAGTAAPAVARLMPYRQIEYRAGGGLPALTDPQPAYKLSGTVERADVERLAKALGLDAAVTHENDTWSVVTTDHRLDVYPSAIGSWSFQPANGVVGVASSGVAEACAPPPSCSAADNCPAVCAPPETTVPPPPPKDLPSKDEAISIAKRVAAAGGLDTESATVTVDAAGSEGWSARVTPSLDGLPAVGLELNLVIGSKGAIVYGNGSILRVEKLGDYPVIGTKAGIERLRKGEFGYYGGPQPMTAQASGGAYPAIATDEATAPADAGRPNAGTTEPGQSAPHPPAPPSKGGPAPIDPPVTEPEQPTTTMAPLVVTITGAKVILTMVGGGCPGDGGYLVPSYAFTVEDGSVVPAVPAVTDEYLAATQADQAVATKPGACGGNTGVEGGRPDDPVATPVPAPEPGAKPVEPQPPAPGGGTTGSGGASTGSGGYPSVSP